MSMQAIVADLAARKLISSSNAAVLSARINQPNLFLAELITIYEKRVSMYLASCIKSVNRHLQKTKNTTDDCKVEAIACAIETVHAANFESGKVDFIAIFMHLITRASPELLAVLGISVLPATDMFLADHANHVFKIYMARVCLFKELSRDHVRELCESTQSENQLLLPAYLFNAFIVQEHISQLTLAAMAADRTQTAWSAALSQQMLAANESLITALRSVLYFLCEAAKVNNRQQILTHADFAHLTSNESTVMFIEAVVSGFINGINNDADKAAIFANQAAILNKETSSICLPALSLFGIEISISTEDIQQAVQNANATLTAYRNQQATIANWANTARAAANDSIDKWRASIPEREFKIGVTFGNMPFNLK